MSFKVIDINREKTGNRKGGKEDEDFKGGSKRN